MITSLLHLSDVFPDALDKTAAWLEERTEKLADASYDNFAVVLYDGRTYVPKFPLQTAEDVQMSAHALDKCAHELPDEVVKVAKSHIELAARLKMGRSIYKETFDSLPDTNMIELGRIDRDSFMQKVATVEDGERLAGKYPIWNAQLIREAEAHLVKQAFAFSPEEEVKAAQQLIKAANKHGVKLSDAIMRYDRKSVPQDFIKAAESRRALAPKRLSHLYDRLVNEAQDLGPLKSAQCMTVLDDLSGFAADIGAPISKVASLGDPYKLAFPEDIPVTAESLDKVAEIFGEDFAKEYGQNKEAALGLLSSQEKMLLEQCLNG